MEVDYLSPTQHGRNQRCLPNRGQVRFRVYPPWCEGLNSSALKTQKQQQASFTEF
ncbi:MepB family protein [Corynebacterium sp. ACRPH]|uniref:MepB family protein n=1 Tax=Corynebacterium sp. ACRPH TaxID=2918199 RepID=UPI00351D14D1